MPDSIKYLPEKNSYTRSILVVILLAVIYILENLPNTFYIDDVVFTYIIKPLLWTGVVAFIWFMPHVRPKARLRHRKVIYLWGFIFGLMYILINIAAGFFEGIGKSPYSHSPAGIITNIILVGSSLAGREFARSYLVNSTTKKENYFVFIIIALFMCITSFSVNKYRDLKDFESTVQFIAEYFSPEFSQNLFASYLTYLGGPGASIIYLGIVEGFHWLSPVLPNLKWINTALIGILSPIFFLMIFNSVYSDISQKKKKENEGTAGWIITSIVSISVIWFAVGVFPIYPSVIITGSMEPQIKPGDVILVEKITDMEHINKLKINDVIQFKRDGILISHRIVDIENNENEGLLFKTKGDNNSGPDTDLVKPQDIKGIMKKIVPKIGWVTLLIRSNNEISLREVLF